MNSKQSLFFGIFSVLVLASLLLKETVVTVQYNRAEINAKRQEFMNEKAGIAHPTILVDYAKQKYPYEGQEVGTNLLGYKFPGEYFKYKIIVAAVLAIIGFILIRTNKSKKRRYG